EVLYACFRPEPIKKNEFFAKEGAVADKVGFLKDGIVRAFFLNKAGKEYNKQFFVGPAIIGAYTSLLTRQPNKIAQQAMTDCEIWVARFQDIEALYDRHHQLERMGRKLAEFYFMEKEQKEIEMALLDAEKRYFILRETFPQIELKVSQYHIASYLGITPTQLSRIRKKISEN
ncbi:MAG: Crp/Fnr family transcriptional regulator, partial [Bacteroidota bacterium]